MCGALPARAITFTPAGRDFIRGGLLFPNPLPFLSVDIAIFGNLIFPRHRRGEKGKAKMNLASGNNVERCYQRFSKITTYKKIKLCRNEYSEKSSYRWSSRTAALFVLCLG